MEDLISYELFVLTFAVSAGIIFVHLELRRIAAALQKIAEKGGE